MVVEGSICRVCETPLEESSYKDWHGGLCPAHAGVVATEHCKRELDLMLCTFGVTIVVRALTKLSEERARVCVEEAWAALWSRLAVGLVVLGEETEALDRV